MNSRNDNNKILSQNNKVKESEKNPKESQIRGM